jgi:hypothetical protein
MDLLYEDLFRKIEVLLDEPGLDMNLPPDEFLTEVVKLFTDVETLRDQVVACGGKSPLSEVAPPSNDDSTVFAELNHFKIESRRLLEDMRREIDSLRDDVDVIFI